MSVKRFVKRLPYPIRQGIKYTYGTAYRAIPLRFRYRKVFWDTYNFLQESQWWSREKLEEYQMQQLNNLLHHAYENVPYYRRVFDERGLKPGHIHDLDDLRKLPYLTKEIIQENLQQLVASNYSKSQLRYGTTGGTSGIPMRFVLEKGVTDSKEQAFISALWKRVGFTIGDSCVIMRGDIVPGASEGKYWKYDPVSRYLYLSSYHMTDKSLPKYISTIRDFKPRYIQAYPSAITILARFMKETQVEFFRNVKALLCGSENLYPWQRELLEEVFRCKVYSWYGHSEKAALAGQCERTNYYHIQLEYGIMELIGKDATPVTADDEMGEIVATGFNNFAMPLIRYRTKDLAVPTNENCDCGREYPLLKSIEGRTQDFLVSKEGNLVPLIGARSLISKSSRHVKEAQYYQDKPGKVLLHIVQKRGFTDKDETAIKNSFYTRYGTDLTLDITFVDDIPRTQRGKYRFLIQKLPIEFGDYR
jgi:phenylacetate-CoA ligase